MKLVNEKWLMNEFNTEKNQNIDIQNVTYNSKDKIWWKCEKGHEWQTLYSSRSIRKSKCPYCVGKRILPGYNDFATLFPKLSNEWDLERNTGVNMHMIAPGSHKKVYWKCEKGHLYEMIVQKRTARGDGCPYCSGRYAISGENDLATLRPDVLAFWDYEKNICKPSAYTVGSGKKVYWRCLKNHKWEKEIYRQVDVNDCPYCSGRVFQKGINDVLTLHPELEKIWDVEANRCFPSEMKYSSNIRVWWKCNEGHSWKATMHNIVTGKGCPYCSGRLAIRGVNDLATVRPDLAKEWNFERNFKILPSNILPRSNKKVWWRCEKGHEWRAKIADRFYGCGCSQCSKQKVWE